MCNPGGERLSVEELEHHVLRAIGKRAEVEHLENVIVADSTRSLRFTLEAGHDAGVARVRRVHYLDRNTALDPDVLALEHRAHAAFADEPLDAVFAVKHLPRFERHRNLQISQK